MAQSKIKTLKMIYKNQFKFVDCPKNAKYEECIEIALENFNIASKFEEFIQITNEYGNIYEKHTFEYYNLLFPNPEIIFFIKIDDDKFKKQHIKKERKPLAELTIKRKRCDDENEGYPSPSVTMSEQNSDCSQDSWYEIERDTPVQPTIKKHKPSVVKPKKKWWNLLFNKLFDK